MSNDSIYLILLITPWLILIFESFYKLFVAIRNQHSGEKVYYSLTAYKAAREWKEFEQKADRESEEIDKFLAKQFAEWEEEAKARARAKDL